MAQRAHRKPGRRVARVLAVPAKGEKGRRAALLGYGGLAFSLATGTTFHAVATERSPETVAVLTGDIYTDDPAKAERTTLCDGAGGVTGVPFTDEQRKAIVKESMRRGLSEADAYALAYGDDAKVQIHEDGTVTVDTRELVLANGPVYRKAKKATSADEKGIETQSAGTKTEPVAKPDAERKASQGNRGQKEAGKAKGTATTPKSPTQESPVAEGGSRSREGQAGAAVASEGPYYPDSGENPYDKGLGEAMKDALNPFSRFMDSIAVGEGAAQRVEQSPDGKLILTSTSRITPTLEVVVEVVCSVVTSPEEPAKVSATVRNPLTGQVLSKTSPTDVNEPDEVSNAAIGVAVEAVVTASAGGESMGEDEIVAPVSPEQAKSDPVVPDTGPTTDEVLAESESEVAESAEDVPRAAIGEVVDAVIEARSPGEDPGRPLPAASVGSTSA